MRRKCLAKNIPQIIYLCWTLLKKSQKRSFNHLNTFLFTIYKVFSSYFLCSVPLVFNTSIVHVYDIRISFLIHMVIMKPKAVFFYVQMYSVMLNFFCELWSYEQWLYRQLGKLNFLCLAGSNKKIGENTLLKRHGRTL